MSWEYMVLISGCAVLSFGFLPTEPRLMYLIAEASEAPWISEIWGVQNMNPSNY